MENVRPSKTLDRGFSIFLILISLIVIVNISNLPLESRMVPLVMSGVVMVLSIFNSIKAGYYSGFSQVGLVGSYLVIKLLLII